MRRHGTRTLTCVNATHAGKRSVKTTRGSRIEIFVVATPRSLSMRECGYLRIAARVHHRMRFDAVRNRRHLRHADAVKGRGVAWQARASGRQRSVSP
jgi:hypothetical protein